MYVWTQVVLFAMLAVLSLPALGAMVRWPFLHTDPNAKELAYGMLLAHYLPPGLLGLSLVAVFAAVMSTVDAHMSFAGQVFVNDFYRRFLHPAASPRVSIGVGKLYMCLVMALAIVVATVAVNVIDISIFMLGLVASEMPANWAQWWWWRFNGKARIAAAIGGPLLYLLNSQVVFKHWIHAGASTDYIVVLSSMAATCGLWIGVALLTRPDPEEKLVEFYRRCRPPGWWGPIARKAVLRAPDRFVIARGLLIAAVGMAAVAAGTIAFSCAYVARWYVAGAAATLCLLLAVLFRTTYARFIRSADPQP